MALVDLQLNWGGEGYADYQGYGKVSKSEQQAAQAQAQASQAMATQAQMMTGIMKQQFAQQQAIMSTLMPQLQAMATNPQGFGATAMANMKAQTVGTIGQQLQSAQQNVKQQFATSNLAGLGSGAEQAILGNIQATGAGALGSSLQQLSIANEQAKQQQQQYALGSMGQMAGMFGSQGTATGNMAMQGLSGAMQGAQAQFQDQYTMAQQGSFWQNFAMGALGGLGSMLTTAGTGGAASPLSNMMGRIPGIGQFFG